MASGKHSCPSGKLRYPDKLAARIALAQLVRKRAGRGRQERSYYQCPICRGFHLTSMRS